MLEFDYTLDYDKIDFSKQPELYRIGRGEQGVLLVEPYKSKICKHWRFRTCDKAESARIFKRAYDAARTDKRYRTMVREWRQLEEQRAVGGTGISQYDL
jgi:hypothetical protein